MSADLLSWESHFFVFYQYKIARKFVLFMLIRHFFIDKSELERLLSVFLFFVEKKEQKPVLT